MTELDHPHLNEVEVDLFVEDFAAMLREAMRAVTAEDHGKIILRASERLQRLIARYDDLPSDLNWYKILERAVGSLKPALPDPNDYRQDYDRLARLGMKLFIELTANDEFSTARRSKARDAIIDEIKSIPEWRKLRKELKEWN